MDRKLCVLIYSMYSSASKKLIEYIQSLPYDLVAVTGITLLCADSVSIRDKLTAQNITTVPCLIIHYFNGQSQTLENDDVYKFITSVSRSIGYTESPSLPSASTPLLRPLQPPSSVQPAAVAIQPSDATIDIVSRDKVMDAAVAMQKSREAIMESSLDDRLTVVPRIAPPV